ncbi:neuroligin 1 [Haematobia irritans]|uniref:neuroligin 1 n=1 Tax=Haematobia irritans TaxID=7368 RepID=UPI003F50149E
MYVKYSMTRFWILWLTFVSIHHNRHQFEYTSAAAIILQPQLQQPTDAVTLFKGPRQKTSLPEATTKEVIGDVEQLENLANTILQRPSTKKEEAEVEEKTTKDIESGKAIKENSIKSILALRNKEKTQKLNATINDGNRIDDTISNGDVQEAFDASLDLMKLSAALQQQHQASENSKFHVKYFKQKIDGDHLNKDFKENLQKLLKSNNHNDDDIDADADDVTGAHNRGPSYASGSPRSSINKSQNDKVYPMATSTSSTMKRAASSPATPQARTTSMTHPFSSSSSSSIYGQYGHINSSLPNIGYSGDGSAAGPAKQLPFAERRHIVPEKLQYTEEITIKQGRLMGIRRNFHPSAGIRDVDQYLGIPYAEAPVGSRRFMPPGAALPWQGLKMAHHLPPVCPQKLPDISLQGTAKMSKSRYRHLTRLLPYLKTESEDCLYLNVYVPNANQGMNGGPSTRTTSTTTTSTFDSEESYENRSLYPVIVYIHGESFEWNSGNAYDGSVLASYGEVIVVTVNYRIGILGFMRPSINENTVANFGLLDQIAALHWIKENIHSFGGDKDSVTLMGHSTGAACINYLMISPVASGLFHRAILMSGSAMSDWSATNHSMQLTMQIAHGLNCPLNDDNEEMLSCLRQKRYQDILKIPISMSQFSTSLGPIVDGHVIPNQPYKVMGQNTEHFSRYDLLFGITESESYHSLGAAALDEGLRENERDNLLRFYMQSRFDIRPDLALAATLKKYSDMYTNPIKATNMEHRDVVLDILSDARVVGPLIQTGLFHAEVNRRNYMYVFGHNSFGGPHAVLPHSIAGEELAFVFGAPLSSAGLFHGIHYTAQEKLLAEAVMSYWCNFAKTGNPKAPWKESFINLHAMEWDRYDLEWPEFNKRSQAYMNIGIPPSIGYKYRHVYMHFWNKELPDELNQIAHIEQQQPFLEANYANTMPSPASGTTSIYSKPYIGSGGGVGGSEVITGHMNKFGARDNGAEDPVRTLKVLMQEPNRQKLGETAENMYNAPPSTTYVGKVRHRPISSAEEGFGEDVARSFDGNYNNFGYPARAAPPPTTSASIYGIRHYDAGPTTGLAAGNSFEQTQFSHPYANGNGNTGNYASEDNKAVDGLTDADSQQEHVAKSETTLQLLIGLIIIFIILNVIIYSTILMQKKKKTQSIQRKLGTGILRAYDGTNDDELKRSKPSTHQDDGDSYIMDALRKTSNAYEAVKTERTSMNGFKMTRQLSCSTVDTHTKVSEWMCTTGQNKVDLPRRTGSTKDSKKSSSFSSMGGSGSFGKHPLKVSVAIDATSDTRGSSVMEQEPIEVTKSKSDGRNRIICQEVEVEDQELLTPQDSLDNSRYTLMRQHSTVTEVCEGELIQPMHFHSRSDPVDMYYSLNPEAEEKVTSFMHADACMQANDQDINVTSKDDNDEWPVEALTHEQQVDVIKRKKYPKVLPTHMRQGERETESPPMTKDLSTTYKRNSLPPNSFFIQAHQQQQHRHHPPLPPPRTVATLGRKPSLGRRNSNGLTTSPLMLAHDCTEEEEEPKITENTLIVGSLRPTEGYYSTLKRKNKPAQIETNPANFPQSQQSVFQSFESSPMSETPEREVTAHLTQKVYSVQPVTTPTDTPQHQHQHHPSCYAMSEPNTPIAMSPSLATSSPLSSPTSPVYAQPKKSHIPRIIAANSNSLLHSTTTTATSPSSAITPSSSAMATAPASISSEGLSSTSCKTGPHTDTTTNCCHVTPMQLDDNQVSSRQTLPTPDVAEMATVTTTTMTTTPNQDKATMQEEQEQQLQHQQLVMAQSRIPQLHRNANAIAGGAPQPHQQNPYQPHLHLQHLHNHQHQQAELINKDKATANVIPKGTNNILTSIPKQNCTTVSCTPPASTPTDPSVVAKTSGLCSSVNNPASDDAVRGYDVPKVLSSHPSSNRKTASLASSSSSASYSSSSTSSSMQSDSATSTSTTSSSTGTVRTELHQHLH